MPDEQQMPPGGYSLKRRTPEDRDAYFIQKLFDLSFRLGRHRAIIQEAVEIIEALPQGGADSDRIAKFLAEARAMFAAKLLESSPPDEGRQ